MQQLDLALAPADHFDPRYFVQHSGLTQAHQLLSGRAQLLVNDLGYFAILGVYGPKGCGKSHLLRTFLSELQQQGIALSQIAVFDWSTASTRGREQNDVEEKWIADFVSCYESLKSRGGLVLVESDVTPLSISENPHLKSRLVTGDYAELRYPQEQELEPVLRSLLERKNLKLSEQSIRYLLRRLPCDLLSFDNISARINEISLSEASPARLSIVKRALVEEESGS